MTEAVLPARPVFDAVTGTVSSLREVRRFTPAETQGLINTLPVGVGTPENPAAPVRPPLSVFRDGSGNITQVATDAFGAPTQLIDPLGRTTMIDRDVNGQPARIIPPDGSQTTLLYDSRGNLTLHIHRLIDPRSPASFTPLITRFAYDPRFSQVTKITDARRDNPFDPVQHACPNGCTTTIEHDARGNPVSITDALGNVTAFTYDARGLLLTATDALGTQTPAIPDDHQTRFTYDPLTGNLLTTTDPLNHLTQLEYDATGNVQRSTDAALRSTAFTYDAMNRLTAVTDPLGATTGYAYDAAGDLTQVTDAKGQATTFAYDALDLLSRTTNPLTASKQFFYDAARNLAQVTDAKNQTITFTYDAANQIVSKVLKDATATVQDTVTYGYDVLGNLTLVQDRDSQLMFVYDSAGRLIKNTVGDVANPVLAQVPETFAYSYDPNGNRRSMGCSRCLSLTYSYDGLNRLTGATSRDRLSKQFEYDALSRLTRLAGGAGSQSLFTYDAASQLLTLSNLMLGTEVAPSSYTYDLLGNRQTLTDRFGLHQYGYDVLSRLTGADHPLASGLINETFTYDPVGNRTSSHLSTTHVHNAANRLLEDAIFTYTYDANGNRTSKTDKTTLVLTTYTYDVENQLTRVDLPRGQVATYRYDSLGRRIEKAVNGTLTRYLYDEEDIVGIFTGPTNCQTHVFLHGPGIDQPLGFFRDTNADCNPFVDFGGFGEPIVDLLGDGLGSRVALAAETHGFFRAVFLTERYAYDSFGMPTITGPGPDNQLDTGDDVTLTESALGNPFLFTGREYDTDTCQAHRCLAHQGQAEGLRYCFTKDAEPMAGDRLNTKSAMPGSRARLMSDPAHRGGPPRWPPRPLPLRWPGPAH